MNPLFENKYLVDEELKFVLDYKNINNDTWPIHWEDGLEILHGIYGEVNVMADKEVYHMGPGDTVIINAQTLHNSSSDNIALHYCLRVKREWFSENGIDLKGIRFENFIHDPVITQLFDELNEQQSQKPDILYTISLKRALANLLIYLLTNYCSEAGHTTHSKGFSTVLEVMRYITEHYSEQFNLDELAAKFGYSKYHFSRLFKQNTDMTVVDYINAIRCEVASELLRKGAMSITEISHACGFNTPPYFAKQFKKIYGISPTDFRKQS